MADGRRYGLSTQLDIQQILLEAQNRWLRPPEICEILKNSRNFRIAPEPPNKPPSGSLFLFDRKVLRYFRKDGHNWRKKKDGKTVREAHERLKAGSVDVLHCYYAHGEENENFQRRSYWMLEEDLMHIVLVHYREVKGNKTNFSRIRHPEETSPTVQLGSPVSSNYLTDLSQVPSQTVDTSSLTHASEYDDAESDNHQASSRYRSFLDLQRPEDGPMMNNQIDAHLLNSYFPASYPYDQSDYQGKQLNFHELNSVPLGQDNVITGFNDARFGLACQGPMKKNGVASWEEGLGNSATGFQSAPFQPAVSSTQSANSVGIPKENALLGQFFTDEQSIKHEIIANSRGHAQWQIASEDDSSNVSMWSMDHRNLDSELSTGFQEQKGHYVDVDDHDTFSTNSDQENSSFMPNGIQLRLSNTEVGGLLTSDLDVNDQSLEENISYFSARHQLKDCSTTGEEGLKKFDSFSRWMSKELGEMDGPTQSTSQIDWDTVENGNVVEDSSMSPQVHPDYLLTPSLSKDQLFSILDFSPNWAYTGMETKVLITGKFLKDKNDVQKCKWSCMFGEVEVPAEVLADGVLRCCAPVHAAGRVPFYVTCSNRLACSEIREFEYLVEHTHNVDTLETSDGSTNEIRLRVRLGKLLSLDSISYPNLLSSTVDGITYIRSKISSLLRENDDEWFEIERLTAEEEFSPGKVKEQLLQKILKEKLHAWLLQKVAEDGKGPCVLDKEGQGVIHLAAALGYDWAIAPTIVAGVHINFRDVRGWTAIHWAAFCGRERTVALLVSLGGNPGALTDPTPKFSSGSTPADLASSNGHKGIAGYLAESSLTSHLADLTLKETLRNGDASEIPSVKAFQTVGEWSATRFNDGDIHDRLSLKDSLTAVRNAAQAAARIHEVYRVHSFHRKQLIECGDDKYGMSEERALSLISIKSNKSGHHDEPIHTAAIRIQNKFRGWKGRKEFLITRQRIIKIQAHVRGHQVRKQYRKVIWSVGIVEKAILRWRRKGSGLRGFRSEGLVERTSMQSEPTKDDDYDFLKVGRKQTEERLEKALARVRSMVQYPEARDQYQRLLNVVTEFQETKVLERLMNGPEEDVEVDDMIELEQLLADDTFMSMASESDLGPS